MFLCPFLICIEASEKNFVVQKLLPKSSATYVCLHFFENQKHLLGNAAQFDKVCGITFVKKNF